VSERRFFVLSEALHSVWQADILNLFLRDELYPWLWFVWLQDCEVIRNVEALQVVWASFLKDAPQSAELA
jgi:hypothetical protein